MIPGSGGEPVAVLPFAKVTRRDRSDFLKIVIDLQPAALAYWTCVIKRFQLEHSLPAGFIAKPGTETVMAQRTVNQDARPGT